MTSPYPLRTAPLFRDYIWGGRNLETVLGKAIPSEGVWAESWEIIDHPEHQSLVTNGPLAGKSLSQIATELPAWLFGTQQSQLRSLPLLLKYLDCQRVLSVQVHPDDEYAQRMSPPDLGKTEAWYIVAAEPGAKLYAGLRAGIGRDQLQQALANGNVEDCLHVLEPRQGDCVFIPAGTVHALGAGLLVAEIQQASNTTFRLFDWNRLGHDGQPRALHIEAALEVIDFDSGPRAAQLPRPTDQPGRETLVHCAQFVLDRLSPKATSEQPAIQIGGDQRLHLLTAPYGNVQLNWSDAGQTVTEPLSVGQSVLLPAAMPTVSAQLDRQAVLLDMYVPDCEAVGS